MRRGTDQGGSKAAETEYEGEGGAPRKGKNKDIEVEAIRIQDGIN